MSASYSEYTKTLWHLSTQQQHITVFMRWPFVFASMIKWLARILRNERVEVKNRKKKRKMNKKYRKSAAIQRQLPQLHTEVMDPLRTCTSWPPACFAACLAACLAYLAMESMTDPSIAALTAPLKMTWMLTAFRRLPRGIDVVVISRRWLTPSPFATPFGRHMYVWVLSFWVLSASRLQNVM